MSVLKEHVERVKGEQFDLMTVRALAKFTTLFFMADSLSIKSALLQKGKKWESEINDATKKIFIPIHAPCINHKWECKSNSRYKFEKI